MLFSKVLFEQATPEWRKYYLDYDGLKNLIDDLKITVSSVSLSESLISEHKKVAVKIFMSHVRQEKEKIDNFYLDRIRENTEIWKNIEQKWALIERLSDDQIELSSTDPTKAKASVSTNSLRRNSRSSIFFSKNFNRSLQFSNNKKKQKSKIKRLTHEFYYSLGLLRNYYQLNQEGFRKILKKFDKNLKVDDGHEFYKREILDYSSISEKNAWYQRRSNVGLENECCSINPIKKTVKDHNPEIKMGQLQLLLKKTEQLAIFIEKGDVKKAMNEIRVPKVNVHESNSSSSDVRVRQFVGILLGIQFSIWALIGYKLAIASKHSKNDDSNSEISPEIVSYQQAWSVFRIYRPAFYLVFYLYLIAADISAFQKTGINYALIFELDPRIHINKTIILGISAAFSILIFGMFYFDLFIVSTTHGYLPVILYSLMILFLINPLPTLFKETRYWLIRKIGRACTCGLMEVRFMDFWLADQFNSLASAFQDIITVFCILIRFFQTDQNHINDDIIYPDNLCQDYAFGIALIFGIIPPFMRFGQCIRRFLETRQINPHLLNAGKYTCGMVKAVFVAYTVKYSLIDTTWLIVLFVLSNLANAISTTLWDFYKDWSLLDQKSENKYAFVHLRNELVLPKKYWSIYFYAIMDNLLLRWIWIVDFLLKILIFSNENVSKNWSIFSSTIFTGLELFRRGVWNFFRLENEHLNNCGDFRVMRRIRIKSEGDMKISQYELQVHDNEVFELED